MKYELTPKQKPIFIITMLCIFGTIAFLFLLLNIKTVSTTARFILSAFSSVTTGLIIAYFLTKPVNFIERKWHSLQAKKLATYEDKYEKSNHTDKKASARIKSIKHTHPKLLRAVSIILAYAILFAAIAGFIGILIPQLVNSITALVRNFDSYVKGVETFIEDISDSLHLANDNNLGEMIADKIEEILSNLNSELSQIAITAWNISTEVISALVTFFLGVVVSIYFIASKESLVTAFRKLTISVFPAGLLKRLIGIVHLADDIFIKYITGRVIDSIIVGIISIIIFSILRMPYALLITVITATTNMIPILGPYMGGIPSVFIVLVSGNPVKAIILAAVIVGIQQLDGNFIDPRITGKRTGISGFWVLVSVLVATSLFGIPGVLLCVPTVSVIFYLMNEFGSKRLKKKGLPDTQDTIYAEKTINELNEMSGTPAETAAEDNINEA